MPLHARESIKFVLRHPDGKSPITPAILRQYHYLTGVPSPSVPDVPDIFDGNENLVRVGHLERVFVNPPYGKDFSWEGCTAKDAVGLLQRYLNGSKGVVRGLSTECSTHTTLLCL